MIGLMVLFIYFVIVLMAWGISSACFDEKSKRYALKRGGVTLVVAIFPLYIYIPKKIYHDNKCSEVFYFHPDTRLERPSSIFVNGLFPFDNDTYFDSDVAKRYVENYKIDFLITSPSHDFSIDKYKSGGMEFKINGLSKESYSRSWFNKIISNTGYALVSRSTQFFGFVEEEVYIFDLKEGKKLSGYSLFYPVNKGSDSLESILSFGFKSCNAINSKSRVVSHQRELIKDTFK
ncbi:hypothetical protein [Pleionea sediminis]|uniref:hypothetical protein n=1 Tax=Pleionea sediminis TaxID=2569479 RepID=UPI001186C5C3|nr:hypothetical protein [Pleionea sediminis]